MNVIDIEDDIFANLKKGDVIAHGCNSFGVAGGFAGVMKEKFPKNFKRYKDLCDIREFRPGSAMYYKEKGIAIYNLGTQFKPGSDANMMNIRSSVKDMLNYAAFRDEWEIKTVRLGCGIGGLTWEQVKPELEKIDHPVTLHVYYKEEVK